MSPYALKFNIEMQFPIFENVAEYILKKVEYHVQQGFGELPCIGDSSYPNSIYKYNDVEPYSRRVALWLTSQGFKQGDTVLYSSHNGANLHIFLLGVWRIGGVARSSYPEDHGDELIERIQDSQVKWILCDHQNVEQNISAIENISWKVNVISALDSAQGCYSLDEIFETELRDLNKPPTVKASDDALILQTSGTTGRSKGAVYTHEGLLRNICIFQQMPFLETFLLTSRLTHFTGTVIPLAFIAANRRILINSKPCTESILNDIRRHKIKGLLAFPKFLLELANSSSVVKKHDLRSLKYVVTAGQIVGPSFVTAVKTIPSLESLYVIYGMTEIGIISVNVDWMSFESGDQQTGLDELRPHSCGKLAPGTELKVKDVNTGEDLGQGEIGEFYFRSPYSCAGYFKNVEVTNEIFKEGWIRTGDVGFADKDGFIYIKDRIKDIFKYFNNHICPSELENVLLQHPNVVQACVIGVPDADGGDTIPRAFVVLANANDSSESLTQIKTFLNDRVASYKQLRGGIFELKDLPMGKSGKVMRTVLQTLYIPTP